MALGGSGDDTIPAISCSVLKIEVFGRVIPVVTITAGEGEGSTTG